VSTKAGDERSGDSEHARVRFELSRDEKGSRPAASETLWAIPTSVPGHYRIDNIPFFVVGVSVGDVVLAEPNERTLEFVRVVEKSGHRSLGLRYRSDQVRSAVRTRLTEMGCDVERGDTPKVLAVDIPPAVSLDEVTALLAGLEEIGELSFYENDVGTRPTPPRRWRRPSTPPFSEGPDLGVFVSRRAMTGDGIRVIDHDEDGDWIFLTGEELRDDSGGIAAEELTLICLQDVVASHPEVHACADLPPGYSAEYLESEHRWLWSALEPEE
jgi:hypothetical protein